MSSVSVDMTPKLFFLDIEVDSVAKEKWDQSPCITQIAVICPSKEKTKRCFNAYINPPKELAKKKQETNFDSGSSGPMKYSLSHVWPCLKKWVNEELNGNQNAAIVMHNGYEHDWPIIKTELARIGEGVPKHWKPFCSLYLANALKIPGGHSLTELCHTFGVEILKAHNAQNDAAMLEGVFGKMIEDADTSKVLRAMCQQEHPVKAVATLVKAHRAAMFVFFDFEATGLFPKVGESQPNPRAVELAGYIPESNAEFSSLINPGCEIPKSASDIHHIYDKDVKDAKDFKHVWVAFENWIDEGLKKTGKKVACLAGHNIWGYDLKLYEAECERTGLKKKIWKSFDTLWLSRSVFSGIKGISHKLQDLRRSFGIKENHAHRALGDVRVNHLVFQKFTEGVPEEKIQAALRAAHPVLTMKAAIQDAGSFKPSSYSASAKETETEKKQQEALESKEAAEEDQSAWDPSPFLLSASSGSSSASMSSSSSSSACLSSSSSQGKKRSYDDMMASSVYFNSPDSNSSLSALNTGTLYLDSETSDWIEEVIPRNT